ncbi:MAG TPA: hypothetical protein VHQ43_09840 [Solirubrobacterales bacterium]|jgi:hypothetical protein|nr:hypothetical protein [Solirubrobacterales bacterium]
MLRRRQIHADTRGHIERFLSAIADLARWPFERLAWTVERRLVWPLRERLAGWSLPSAPSGRVAGAGALAAVVAAAALGGLLLSAGHDGSSSKQAAAPAPVALTTPAPQPAGDRTPDRVLHGVTPSFGVAKGVGVDEKSGGGEAAAAPEATDEGTETAAEALETLADEGGATASSAKPVPAGPAAMKVARRFTNAFVFYEVGERPARAKAIFTETAAPQLAEALAERPPRLPEETKVPKAKVLNLVPGPRHGKAYTVSASLLRVGLTSELRLEMMRQEGEWLVTDVRG